MRAVIQRNAGNRIGNRNFHVLSQVPGRYRAIREYRERIDNVSGIIGLKLVTPSE